MNLVCGKNNVTAIAGSLKSKIHAYSKFYYESVALLYNN